MRYAEALVYGDSDEDSMVEQPLRHAAPLR